MGTSWVPAALPALSPAALEAGSAAASSGVGMWITMELANTRAEKITAMATNTMRQSVTA